MGCSGPLIKTLADYRLSIQLPVLDVKGKSAAIVESRD